MTLLTRLEAFLKSEAIEIQTALAPVEKELQALTVPALKNVLAAGVQAVVAGLSGGVGNLTLSAAEALAVTAGHAALASAAAQGEKLTEHAALALGASLVAGVAAAPVAPVPVPGA